MTVGKELIQMWELRASKLSHNRDGFTHTPDTLEAYIVR